MSQQKNHTPKHPTETEGAPIAEEPKIQEGGEASAAESQPASQTPDQPADLALENQRLREELSELKDQYLRKAADMDNYRKRMQREKEEAIKYANAQLLTDVITILDDFERAIASSTASRDFDSFHQGIQMIESQFLSLLERKYGLKRLDSLGEPFDPNIHEALAGGGAEHAVVLEVYQKGYMLQDRVLRPARVRVGTQESQNTDNTNQEETKN